MYSQKELYDMSDKTYPLSFYNNFYDCCSNGVIHTITCIDCNITSDKVKFADKSRCNSCKNKQNIKYNRRLKILLGHMK